MAQRAHFTDIASHESGRNFIDLQWTSEASGAVPTTLTRSIAIASVTHTGTGAYTIVPSAPWVGMLNFKGNIMQASYSKAGACDIRLIEDHLSSTSAPEIKVLVVDGDGDAVDPTTSDVVYLTIEAQLLKAGY